MWLTTLYIISIGFLLYLGASTVYLLLMALAGLMLKQTQTTIPTKFDRFAILVPAHNEELLISALCENLLSIDYPPRLREIYVVADNCDDKTAQLCAKYAINVLVRHEAKCLGKGFAIQWALERIPLDKFDAILMVDADTHVDPLILRELNSWTNSGERALQCYIKIPNRGDSWFTQLLSVARVINGLLYHHSKQKLGLSSYLMGTGICFRTDLLRNKGWTAFSIAEDWEYYAQLIEDRVRIAFAVNAIVFQQESRSLDQATSQRLRWASGKFNVARKLGWRLFVKGLRENDWFTLDASLALIFPNYSLLVNLTILTLVATFLFPSSTFRTLIETTALALLAGQALLFSAGAYLARSYGAIFRALLYAPLFLAWKMVIDFFSLTGIYRGNTWVRTKRHDSKNKSVT
jgi:1,2-diacylglycerol 3-beta-glucosyltransferase